MSRRAAATARRRTAYHHGDLRAALVTAATALLAAVAEDGFRQLQRAIARAARPHRRDPIAALRAMAIALVRFAASHPSHYRLMSGPAVRGRDHPALRDAAVAAWELLAGGIKRCQRAGRIRPGDPVELSFALWCTVHGLAVLAVDEQIPADVLKAVPLEQLAEHTTRCLLEGLAPRPS